MRGYRRRRGGRHSLLGRFSMSPNTQYVVTIVSAVVFAGFVFSGFLVFRYTDSQDLIARGKAQMAEGKVAWAAKTFQTLVTRYQDNYEGHLLLGQAYLDLGERKKAEDQFRIASAMEAKNLDSGSADIALSKLAVVRKNFDKAEEKLLASLKKSRHSKSQTDPEAAADLKRALVELYEHWGDYLLEDHQDHPAAIDKYEKALWYVEEYRVEEKLKDKIVEASQVYSENLMSEKKYVEAVTVLKKSLQHRYLPETLIAIAEAYERKDKLDDAIYWYQRAFDVNPNVISIKLSNMLVQKGRQLLDENKPDEAQRYFDQSDEVGKFANVPVDSLYPVLIKDVELIAEVDDGTGEVMPEVRLAVQNKSHKILNFLVVKASFYAGDKLISEQTKIIASPKEPLAVEGAIEGTRKLTLAAPKRINSNHFSEGILRVKISIAYSESDKPDWLVKSVQEKKIPVRHPVDYEHQNTGEPV